jgi:hypothetical protein
MTECSFVGCHEAAIAYVSVPSGGPPGTTTFAIIRPLSTSTKLGDLLCVNCTHVAVDLMLMRAKEGTH